MFPVESMLQATMSTPVYMQVPNKHQLPTDVPECVGRHATCWQ